MAIKNPFSEVAHWDMVSTSYLDVASWIMTPFSEKAIELTSVESGYAALDVACGTGTLAIPLSMRVKNVEAVDFSEKMLSGLNTLIKEKRIKNVRTAKCDGQDLPFESNRFDAAFSMFGLMFFPDRIRGFKELQRVLRPRKMAAVASWAPIKKSSLMTLLAETIQKVLPDAPSPRKNSSALDNPDDFKREMEEGGFEDVVIHEVTSKVPALPPGSFWQIMSNGGPLVMFKQKAPEKQWNDISKKAIEYLSDKIGDDGTETYTTAYIGIGRK